MPYEIDPINGTNMVMVVNKDTGTIKTKRTTKIKAKKQIRFLYGIEHGMKPFKRGK